MINEVKPFYENNYPPNGYSIPLDSQFKYFSGKNFKFEALLSLIKAKGKVNYKIDHFLNLDKKLVIDSQFIPINYKLVSGYYLINKYSEANKLILRIGYPYNKLNPGDFEMQSKEIELKIYSLLNSIEGEIDFSKPETSTLLNYQNGTEFKLMFNYSKIEGKSSDLIKIPAICLSLSDKGHFVEFLNYLKIPINSEIINNEVFKTYFRKFIDLTKSTDKTLVSHFYSNTPFEFIESIILKKQNALDIIKNHFKFLLSKNVRELYETAILHIIDILSRKTLIGQTIDSQKISNSNFLDFLLSENIEGKNLFFVLYDKMNDFGGNHNFTIYINKIFGLWLNSKYSDFKNFISDEFVGSPSILFYYNEKFLGFNKTNTEIIYEPDLNGLRIKKVVETIIVGAYVKEKVVEFLYQLFQPIYIYPLKENGEIVDSTVAEGKLEIQKFIPAFYLKAINDQLGWENFEKASWLTLDVVTTFTGVGNVAKFRHLNKISKAIKAASTITKGTKSAINVYKTIKLTAGVVEITSGSVNALLKLADQENENWGRNLSNLLAILELLSLTGEISGALKKALNREAKSIIDNYKEFESGLEMLKSQGVISEVDVIETMLDICKLAGEKELTTLISRYVKTRKKIKSLNEKELIKLFFETVEFRHFTKSDSKTFYEKVTKEYPKLLEQKDDFGNERFLNIAQFETTFVSRVEVPNGLGSNKVEKVVDLVHSGNYDLYDDFIKPLGKEPIKNEDSEILNIFRKSVTDLENYSRKADSEFKYIFHFLSSYVSEADEFIIETKNIFITCDSCKRELIMLKEFVEKQLGKKMTIIVYGDKEVLNYKDFVKYVLN